MYDYDAVVVMGSGFSNPETDELDRWAIHRLNKAVEAAAKREVNYIIITGNLKHPKTGTVFALKAEKFVSDSGIGPIRIWPAVNPVYPIDTEGDVVQALGMASYLLCRSLLIITEKPHYYFRVRRLLKIKTRALGFNVRLRFRPSMPAPWWYWLKEFVLWVALLLSPHKGKHSWLYHFLDRLWRQRIGPKFLQYVVRRD